MSKDKIRALQIRLGVRTASPLKEWFDKQTAPNDSTKKIIEHFISIYGTNDIDSDEIQIAMAKDLLISKGELLPTNNKGRFKAAVSEAPTHTQITEGNEKYVTEKIIKEPEPIMEQVSEEDKIPVGDRGPMNGI